MPVVGSKQLRRLRPASITRVTPSIVRELSAMAVASTSFPAGLVLGSIARLWAARDRLPCRGQSSSSRPQPVAAICSWQCWIWRCPGRNTSTVSEAARWSSQWLSRARTTWAARDSRSRGGWCWIATGWLRPSLVSNAASGNCCCRGCRLRVADISSSRSCGASRGLASRSSARARSASLRRSWNSSKITQLTPARLGSAWSCRRNRPSVSTSMRVAADTRLSSRTR